MKVTARPVVDRLAFPTVRLSQVEKEWLGRDVVTVHGSGQVWCRCGNEAWWVVTEDGKYFAASTRDLVNARSQIAA